MLKSKGSMLSKALSKGKTKAPEGPAPHQEAPPTGEHIGEAPVVANLGEFNPNVNDHAHVQKGPRRHASMAMATHMAPKADKWSHHTKETVADLKHLSQVLNGRAIKIDRLSRTKIIVFAHAISFLLQNTASCV
jgi:hypothetical protein